MKAIILQIASGVDQLKHVELNLPTIEEREVLVQINAISINPIDVKTRNGQGVYGLIKDESPIILGWDIAGIVTESKSTLVPIGSEVFGMVNFPIRGGAYAEYIKVPADQLALKPSNVKFEEAAATTLAALTAWQALTVHTHIKEGQHVLIHAASGGVGHFAVQIAKYFGAHVTGTSSLKNKDFIMELGADQHIDYSHYDWSNHNREFDLVLDTIGGENIDHSIQVTKRGGIIISIPTGKSEAVTEKAQTHGIIGKPIRVEPNGKHMKQIANLLEKGIIKPHISKLFDFNEMAEAHLQQETGRTVGKIVVKI